MLLLRSALARLLCLRKEVRQCRERAQRIHLSTVFMDCADHRKTGAAGLGSHLQFSLSVPASQAGVLAPAWPRAEMGLLLWLRPPWAALSLPLLQARRGKRVWE